MTIGVVVFSFGKRREELEPGPCNMQLGHAAKLVIDALVGYEPRVVAQWEVARQLEREGCPVNRIVAPDVDGYLDSAEVWNQAKKYFRKYNIHRVVVVAQPFLQRRMVRTMVTESGYMLFDASVRQPRIGYDNSRHNLQWWTKGPLRLLLYAAIVRVTGKHGIGERPSWE